MNHHNADRSGNQYAFPGFTRISHHLGRYVDLGWHIIPGYGLTANWPAPDRQACSCERGMAATCSQPGKHPLNPWKALTAQPTLRSLLSEAEMHREECYAWPNWALVLGRSNLIALDVDNHDGGPDGAASFAALLDEHGDTLPHTLRDSRGHYLFRRPVGLVLPRTSISVAPGVELFGGTASADHILWIPPSDHHTGDAYRWLDGCDPWSAEAAELPPWLLDVALRRHEEREAARRGRPTATATPSASAPAPSVSDRNHILTRAAAYLAKIPGAVSGQRGHDITFKVACKLVEFGLEYDDALSLFRDWNKTCDPEWTTSDLTHKLDGAYENAVKGRKLTEMRDRRGSGQDPRIQIDDAAELDRVAGLMTGGARRRAAVREAGRRASLIAGIAALAVPLPAELVAAAAAEAALRESTASASAASLRHRNPTLCPKCFTEFKGDPATGNVLALNHRCKSLDCPECLIIYKAERVPHFAKMLRECGRQTLYAGATQAAASFRKNFTHDLTDLGGLWLQVRIAPDTDLTVSTVPFDGAEPITAAEAIRRVTDAINEIPADRAARGSGHPIHACKPWKMPRTRDPKKFVHLAWADRDITWAAILDGMRDEGLVVDLGFPRGNIQRSARANVRDWTRSGSHPHLFGGGGEPWQIIDAMSDLVQRVLTRARGGDPDGWDCLDDPEWKAATSAALPRQPAREFDLDALTG